MSSKHLAIGNLSTYKRRGDTSALLWGLIEFGERTVAIFLLVFFSPILFAAGLILTISSRRSPLIAHRRLGLTGRALWVLKLRTMWSDQPLQSWHFVERLSDGPCPDFAIKRPIDPRVGNWFAALCRRYSVDELPQLWQVVRGEMALVGPRPLTMREVELHYVTQASELLSRKPGITGLWQVRGRSSLTYRQRRRLDVFLLRRWCFGLYVRIAFATIPAVVTGKDAW